MLVKPTHKREKSQHVAIPHHMNKAQKSIQQMSYTIVNCIVMVQPNTKWSISIHECDINGLQVGLYLQILISVMVWFKWTVNANSKVFGLVSTQFGQFDPKSIKMQPGNLFIKLSKQNENTHNNNNVFTFTHTIQPAMLEHLHCQEQNEKSSLGEQHHHLEQVLNYKLNKQM